MIEASQDPYEVIWHQVAKMHLQKLKLMLFATLRAVL